MVVSLVYVCAWRFARYDLPAVASALASVFAQERANGERRYHELWCAALAWQNALLNEVTKRQVDWPHIRWLLGVTRTFPPCNVVEDGRLCPRAPALPHTVCVPHAVALGLRHVTEADQSPHQG